MNKNKSIKYFTYHIIEKFMIMLSLFEKGGKNVKKVPNILNGLN